MVVARSRLWQAGQKNDDDVGVAFAVLECAIERSDELMLPLDSCMVDPHISNALLCLVAGGCAEMCSPNIPLEALTRRNNAAGLQMLRRPVPPRVERCSTDIRDFDSDRNIT